MAGENGMPGYLARIATATEAILAASPTDIAPYVDGLETLATALNGYVDGLEALLGTGNTSTASIAALLTSQAAFLDGLETLIGSTNTLLTTQAGYVDGLETLIGTSNTSLTTIANSLTTIAGYVDGLEGFVDGLEGVLGTSAGAAVVTDASGTIQQYLRGIIVKLIAGPQAAASSLSVTPGTVSSGTKSNVASGIASATILASNAARKHAIITNDDANVLYLDLTGGTASATSYSVQVSGNGGTWEMPPNLIYTGAITGIWAADGSGSARVTEF